MRRPFDHRPFLAPLLPFALVMAALAFTTALTPSLIPRTGAQQGVLAGVAFVAVYGLAAGLSGLWRWLGLPRGRPRALVWVARGLALIIVAYGLIRVTDWQNAVNAAAGIAPVETARPFIIAAVALAIILPTLALGRAFRRLVLSAANRLARFLPERLALGGALLLTAAVFWTVGNGILGAAILRALDSGAQQVDALIMADLPPPAEPVHSGSAASLLPWETLGAAGRSRISAFPTQAQIEALAGSESGPVQTPARVYVGLNSAVTPEARADLALAELIRVDAFSREILVIATPTGTGWINPASLSALEFLWRGDVASVSVQYSYLPSWLTLLVEPEYGAESARTLFRVVHDYWRDLPEDARPRLYLYGLSLGSRNSELSADVWDILSAPYDGAFWVGPTFTNPLWQEFTARRNPGSPAWQPVLGEGSLVRFATQQGVPDDHADAPWGPLRILYLQYPSDAITFFEPESFYRRPEWLSPRAPDVSPAFRWVPMVTSLQLLADLVTAFGTPVGVGHTYAARDYINGWHMLTEPPGWEDAELEALRSWYAERGM